MVNHPSTRKQIVDFGNRMYQRGYVASNDGNISVRLSDGNVMITPSGVSKGYMSTSEMVIISLNGKILSYGKHPSSELGMHLKIYEKREDVNAVCHAHPPYATGFASSGRALDTCLLSEIVFSLGKVPLVPYGTPGTEEIYNDLVPLLPNYNAFLLANHGVVTVGENLESAYHRMESVEHGAKISFIAEQLGGGKPLNKDQVSQLIDIKQDKGIRTRTDCLASDHSVIKPQVISDITLNEIVEKIVRQIMQQ